MPSLPHPHGLPDVDTDAGIAQLQVERWRAMTPAQKFRVVGELNAAVDAMAAAGIRARHPGASSREQFLRLARVKLGPDLAQQAYPDIARLDSY